jgi:tRNA threonylcarbamoyladenosine biosynthesis protein TsaB
MSDSPAASKRRSLILAIECSNPSAATTQHGRAASVVLGHRVGAPCHMASFAGEDIASSAGPSGRGGHDDDLLPAIDRAFRAAGRSPDDLAAVAVSLGPGGYTSLRIAVAAAKMIALATGAKLVGVPTSLVAARTSMTGRRVPACLLVALASKNDTASLTLIRPVDAGMSFKRLEIVSATVGGADCVPAPLAPVAGIESGPVLIADQFLPPSIAVAAANLGYEHVPLALSASEVLASVILDNLPFSDPRTLAPIYAREPDAVTLWRARHPRPDPPPSQ